MKTMREPQDTYKKLVDLGKKYNLHPIHGALFTYYANGVISLEDFNEWGSLVAEYHALGGDITKCLIF